MKPQEWTTIKALLALELDNAQMKFKLDKDVLDELYIRFQDKVERHIFIREEEKVG